MEIDKLIFAVIAIAGVALLIVNSQKSKIRPLYGIGAFFIVEGAGGFIRLYMENTKAFDTVLVVLAIVILLWTAYSVWHGKRN